MMKRYKLIALSLMCALAFSNAAYAAAKNPDAPAELTPEEAAQAEQEERDLIEAAQAMRRSGLVQFNFKEMELVKFVRFMSELLRENIIVPPNINAKITIISPRPSSITESRQIMLSTLQMYGLCVKAATARVRRLAEAAAARATARRQSRILCRWIT